MQQIIIATVVQEGLKYFRCTDFRHIGKNCPQNKPGISQTQSQEQAQSVENTMKATLT